MRRLLCLASLMVAACGPGATGIGGDQAPAPQARTDHGAATEVRTWGGMKAVLRDGETEGRVRLSEVIGPNAVAVGVLDGLGAEFKVVDGVTYWA